VGALVVTSRIDLDHVPSVVRPSEIETAIDEARQLRDRHRLAQEELAQAQQALERAQDADVAAAAERVRQGSAPGALPPAVEKAKRAVEIAERNARAIGLASEQAGQDAVSAISERAESWTVSLRDEAERARETAGAALAALEDAVARIGSSGSAQNWLAAANDDDRYDRSVKPIVAFALSSARRTANNEPLTVGELVSWLREAVEPPTPMPTVEATSAQA
jgi:hypothetical protein